MNAKLGRIGAQEAVCLTAAAACASSIFTTDSALLYGKGNSAYISMLLSAGTALFVFLAAIRAMRKANKESLWELLRYGLGPIVSRLVAALFVILIVIAASSLFERFVLMLGRFVFPDAKEWELLVYMALAALLLAWLGLEGLGRAARLFAVVLALSIIGALVLALGNYEVHRLAPFFGDGTANMLSGGFRDAALFFPALMALLIVTRGVHGAKWAGKAGCIAGIIGGAIAAICQLCIGMTYTYKDLSQMHSPMYRLTMAFRTGGYFPKLDLLLLFGWMLAGTLASGFYIYAAALLFMEAFDQADVRVPLLALFGCAAGLALLMHAQIPALEQVLQVLRLYSSMFFSVPVLLAALFANIRARKDGRDAPGELRQEGETEAKHAQA